MLLLNIKAEIPAIDASGDTTLWLESGACFPGNKWTASDPVAGVIRRGQRPPL